MAERPAVNSSPPIFLSRAGLLDLLQLVAPELVVPTAVASEIQQRGPADLTAQALNQTPWLSGVQTPVVPASIKSRGLGKGESAVLAWAASFRTASKSRTMRASRAGYSRRLS